MDKRDEFQKMLDQILIEIIEQETANKKVHIPELTKNIINMLRNLNKQIADQAARIDRLETDLADARRIIQRLIKLK
jgi:hypothetical protein